MPWIEAERCESLATVVVCRCPEGLLLICVSVCCLIPMYLMCQGFISTEEFASIPELSINPLHTRMGQMFNHVNFKVSVRPCSTGTRDLDLSPLHCSLQIQVSVA